MTWSSDRVGRGEALARVPSDWTWAELGHPGAPGGDATDVEERHAEELEHAFRRGRLEGEERGRAKARQELQSVLSALRELLVEARGSREAWMSQLEENLVALATAMARQLLQRELQADPQAMQDLVRAAAALFPPDQSIKVRMHPDDLARLGDGGEEPANRGAVEGRDTRWIPDETVVRGGYLLEGPARIVDGRVDEALERLFRELTHG